jgi:UDP-3-O-[3-hydroxymyristoyl] glucosamine N-acyltransferase
MTVEEIALRLEAVFEGDGAREIVSGASLERAGPDQAAFVEPGRAVAATSAGCLIVDADFAAIAGPALVRVARPRNAFARLLRDLQAAEEPAGGIDPTAIVALTARLGEDVSIGPYTVIGAGARIGDGCRIGPHCSLEQEAEIGPGGRLAAGVRIYPGVKIGARAVIDCGVALGAAGFGLTFEDGRYTRFPQVGGLRIGDDVEIGANSAIDRGALDDTVVGDGVKLDNMVHIGHNCRIGNHVVIAAQTGLAGQVTVEDYAVLGGQVGIGDKATIGRQAVLGSGSGVLSNKTVAGGQTYWGTPARPLRDYLKNLARLDRLPKLLAEVKALGRRLAELERKT